MGSKQFLLEHNLMDVYNKFMHLCNETTYFSGNLEEEGEEDQIPQQDPNAAGGDMGGAPTDMGDNGNMPQDPNAQGSDMGGDANAQFDPSQQPPMGEDPNAQGMTDPSMQDPSMDMEMPQEDEEQEDEEEDDVIDVDDITNAQEKTNARVNKVGRNLGKVDDKLVDVMNLIKSLKSMIDSNNAEIEAFKTEFEKRNPTPTEKLNLRSLDSYPFNENPTKYWQDKAEQTNVSGNRYEAYANNDIPTVKQEYTLTKDDVTNVTPSQIEDTFHIDDDLRSTIEKIFEL